MEIESALRRVLLEDRTVGGYVQDSVYRHRLADPLSGGEAVVVRRQNGWADPGFGHAEFPRIIVECWSDSTRDDDGAVLRDDAEDRAWALYRAVDAVLHVPWSRHGTRWGGTVDRPGVLVVNCRRDSEPALIYGDDNTDTAQAAVIAWYAAQIVHPGPNVPS